jgi:hypothetical protein
MDINIFNGGWSYTNLEMNELFKNIDLTIPYEQYNIIEFGGGDSSNKIKGIFNNVTSLNYYIVESNPDYLPENKNDFNIILYKQEEIENVDLSNSIDNAIKFDLILIDGPNGDARKYWYEKVKPFIKKNSIILVDDFNHYACFGEELDKHFDYVLLSHSDIPFKPYGEHSWKIVRVLNVK